MNRPAYIPSQGSYTQSQRVAILAPGETGLVFRYFCPWEGDHIRRNGALARNSPQIWRRVP